MKKKHPPGTYFPRPKLLGQPGHKWYWKRSAKETPKKRSTGTYGSWKAEKEFDSLQKPTTTELLNEQNELATLRIKVHKKIMELDAQLGAEK